MRLRIVVRIRALGDDPRPRGSEKLSGGEGRYRVRQWAFRIVYAVDEARKVVEIVKIGHRREIYR
jgi:mRNA interferase RelE/StbE